MRCKYVLIIMLISVIFANDQKPIWIHNPEPGVFVGVSRIMESEQAARIDAEKDAKRQIISSLGGVIESKFIDQIIEKNSRKKLNYTNSKVEILAKNILTVTADKFYIEKIEKKEGLFKKSMLVKAYAAVPFSQTKHHQFISELIAAAQKNVNVQLVELQQKIQQGDVIYALKELQNLPFEYQKYQEITGLTSKQILQLNQLDRSVSQLVDHLANNIYLETDQTEWLTKLFQPVNDPIRLHLYYQQNNQQIPIKRADILIEYHPDMADLIAPKKSDKNGEITIRVQKILTAKPFTINVSTDFPGQLQLTNRKKKLIFTPDNKITLNIDGKQAIYFKRVLSKELLEKGFKIVDKQQQSDFYLAGNVYIDRRNEYMENLSFSWAKADIKLRKTSNSNIISSQIMSKKGAGHTPNAADINAAEKVSQAITENIINQLMNEELNE